MNARALHPPLGALIMAFGASATFAPAKTTPGRASTTKPMIPHG